MNPAVRLNNGDEIAVVGIERSDLVKGFRMPAGHRLRGDARRQASEKPRGRKPRGSSHRQ